MALPVSFIEHLRARGYNSRSNRHSNALAEAIAVDLYNHCDAIAKRTESGRLVYDVNFTVSVQQSNWNVDLVLGPPPPGGNVLGGLIRKARPVTVQIAIEIKSVMTEHRKQIKNRKRDFEAHHEHAHSYHQSAIAGGVLVTNASDRFQSSLRDVITIHKSVDSHVQHCISEMRNVAERSGGSGAGMDAKAVLVVALDNVNLESATYVDRPPAPQLGDPLHYDAFIQRICAEFTERFPH